MQTLVPTVLTTATGTANPAAGAPVTAALAPITVEQPTTSRPAPRAPVVAENVARAQGATTVHKVVSGDTIYDLAITYNTTIEAIMTANAINEFGTLHVGDELIIPAPPEE